MFPLLNNVMLPWAPSMWSIWVQHIMKQRKLLHIKRAALVRVTGGTASATTGFIISDSEGSRIKAAFARPHEVETIRIKGKTYVLKDVDAQQLVAFNGTTYMIVCKSRTLFIVVQCDSRDLYEEAARWLRRVNARLIEKGF